MARVPYLSREDAATAEAEAAWQRLQTERPLPTGNIFRLTAHAPAILDASLDYGAALRHGTDIDSKLRELAIVAVAHFTGVDYAFVHHSGPAVMHGVTPEQLAAISTYETSDLFDEHERAVIRLAHESTVNVEISEETWAAVSSFLSDKELVELVLNIAYYNNGARIMAALRVDLEQPYIDDPIGAFREDIARAAPGG